MPCGGPPFSGPLNPWGFPGGFPTRNLLAGVAIANTPTTSDGDSPLILLIKSPTQHDPRLLINNY